jgi:hypothetical protein
MKAMDKGKQGIRSMSKLAAFVAILAITQMVSAQTTPPEYDGVLSATQPTVYFLHYWGTGATEKLANGFRATLDQLGDPANSAQNSTAR